MQTAQVICTGCLRGAGDTRYVAVISLIAIGSSLVKYARNGWAIADLFRYFTTLANMITALAASFLIPFAINGIRKKRFVTPKWLSMLHYMGTVSTTLILVFALVFILPFDPEFAIGGSNLFLHEIAEHLVVRETCSNKRR